MPGDQVQVPSLEGFLLHLHYHVSPPYIRNIAGQLGLRVAIHILRPTALRFTTPVRQRPVRRSIAPHHASLAFAKRRK
jgi:hypothetical protein